MIAEERKTAKNYRKRVRVILEILLGRAKTVAGEKWHEPAPEQMERFVDCFHHVCNWGLDGMERVGFPVTYYTGPLTEAQITAIENVFLGREQTNG